MVDLLRRTMLKKIELGDAKGGVPLRRCAFKPCFACQCSHSFLHDELWNGITWNDKCGPDEDEMRMR